MRKWVGPAVIALMLLAASSACSEVPGANSDDPGLYKEAVQELKKVGLQYVDGRLVVGVRENAVCGVASGKRFIYRAKVFHPEGGLIIQGGRFPPTMFEALHKAWCAS